MRATLWVLAAILPAQPSAAQGFETLRQATVMVETVGSGGALKGSGVILSSDGIVATAAHVLKGARGARVRMLNGEFLDVIGVIDYDARLDLALIRVKGDGLVSVSAGNSDSVQIGQRLFAIGCPLGLAVSVADGLLSARTTDGGTDLLQISIPVSLGYSGGPVVTENGSVVGIVISTVRGAGATNIGFALPAKYLRQMFDGAAARALRDLADVTREPADSAKGQSLSAGPAAIEPERVNESLTWDFTRLNGVEVSTVRGGQGGVSFATLVQYVVSPGTAGDLVVERRSDTEMREWSATVGLERIRTAFHAGGSNHFIEDVAFVASSDAARLYSSTLEAIGSNYRFKIKAGPFFAGQVPEGVLPPHFLDAAIGALAEAPSSRQTLWLLDPKEGRLVPAVLELGERVLRKIPMGRDGERCGPKARPVKQSHPVLIGTLAIGLTRQPVMVLATPPFLALDDSVTCVWLP